MSSLTVSMSVLLFAACAQVASEVSEEPLLKDCTEATAAYFSDLGWEVPEVPDDVRRRAIREATKWAVDLCYFPCDFVMCGSISSYSPDRVSVYVSYEFKRDELVIGPEASVTFSLPEFDRVGQAVYHTGCRWSADDCTIRRPSAPSEVPDGE